MNDFSIVEQIQRVAPGKKVYQVANEMIVVKGERTTVWNIAMSQMNGRNKLLKYLRTIPRLVFENHLEAVITLEPVVMSEETIGQLEAMEQSAVPLVSKNFNFYYSQPEKVIDRDLLKAMNSLSMKPTLQPGKKCDRFYYLMV
jgi:hypothetical protein